MPRTTDLRDLLKTPDPASFDQAVRAGGQWGARMVFRSAHDDSSVQVIFVGASAWSGTVTFHADGGSAAHDAAKESFELGPSSPIPLRWDEGEERTAWPLIRAAILRAAGGTNPDLLVIEDPGDDYESWPKDRFLAPVPYDEDP